MTIKSTTTTILRDYGLGILVLSGILWFRMRLLHLPIDRDEGEFAYAGWRMLHGGVPYLDFYNMKMPGIYAFYSLLFILFGTGIEAIRLGSILVNLGNAWFIFRLGTKWKDKRAGYYSALCYLVFSVQVELQGTSTHAEAVAMLFVLGGMLLFTNALSRNSTPLFFASGLLEGVAILMKQPAGAFALFFLVVLFIAHAGSQTLRSRISAALAMITGMLLPLCATVVWLASSGAWNQFLLFAFDYAREYISYLTWKDGWHNAVAVLTQAILKNPIFWLIAAIAVIRLVVQFSFSRARRQLLFFLISFIAVSAGFYFRPHYFQFLLPSVALMAGELISATETGILKHGGSRKFLRLAVPALVLTGLLFYASREMEMLGINKEEDFIRKIYGQDFFNATRKTGEFIAANSKPDARLAIFGAEPEIWFYAKRLAASGYLYVYPLLENQKHAAAMKNQFYEEIIKSKPDVLLYTSNDGTWYANREVQREIFQWYCAYRDSSFRRIGMVDIPPAGIARYYWYPDAAQQPLNPGNYFEICIRK